MYVCMYKVPKSSNILVDFSRSTCMAAAVSYCPNDIDVIFQAFPDWQSMAVPIETISTETNTHFDVSLNLGH